MGRGLSKAGVDKDPVIWHSSWKASLGLILRYWNIAYLERVIYYMESSYLIYLGRGLSKAGVDMDPVIWHSSRSPHIWKELFNICKICGFWNYFFLRCLQN